MEYGNALGLTIAPASPIDWDSITVVSLQSLSDEDRKYASVFPFRIYNVRRWRGTRERKLPAAAWSTRFSARVKTFRRRLPLFFHAIAASVASTIPGLASRNPTIVPYPVFSASVSTHQCAACQSNFELVDDPSIVVPCGHHYHANCLLALVESSLHTLSSFPPRCCRQTIPTEIVEPYMPRPLQSAFAQRQAEYDTPKRVYCSNPRCSHFLGARDKRFPVRILSCPALSCGTRTCARCKARVDGPPSRHECSHDPEHRATLQLGSRMGWVRCPMCEELIERHGGCAHMTCVCGAQFCYRCRAIWKTCNCVDWGDGVGADDREARLFAPLEEGGDLGARLALWVPPALERDGNTNRDEETWTDIQPHHWERPRSHSFTFVHPDALAVAVGRPPRPTTTPANPKIGSLPNVWGEAFTRDEAMSCLPFSVDPQILAHGVHAQESRRRSRAKSF